MKMRKYLTAALALIMAFAITACGASGQQAQSSSPTLTLEELQQKMTAQAQAIQSVVDGHAELWAKLFAQVNASGKQDAPEGGIGAVLKGLLEQHASLVTQEERKALEEDVQRIAAMETELKKLEEQITRLTEERSAGAAAPAASGNADGAAASAQGAFPKFEGSDLAGNPVNSAELFAGNKVTVVNFWFSGCAPCVGELDELNALHQQLKEKGGAVVGINTDTLGGDAHMIAEAKQILEQKGITYQNIQFAKDSEAGKLASQLLGFPTTYVVDSQGNIVGQPLMGGVENPSVLKQLQDQISLALGKDAQSP